jgi:hypothetical protein
MAALSPLEAPSPLSSSYSLVSFWTIRSKTLVSRPVLGELRVRPGRPGPLRCLYIALARTERPGPLIRTWIGKETDVWRSGYGAS